MRMHPAALLVRVTAQTPYLRAGAFTLSLLTLTFAAGIDTALAATKIKSGRWHDADLWDPKVVPRITDGAEILAGTSIEESAVASGVWLDSQMSITSSSGLGITNNFFIGTLFDSAGRFEMGSEGVSVTAGRRISVGIAGRGEMTVSQGQVTSFDMGIGGGVLSLANQDEIARRLLVNPSYVPPTAWGKLTIRTSGASVTTQMIGVGSSAGFGSQVQTILEGTGELWISEGGTLVSGGGVIAPLGTVTVQDAGSVWNVRQFTGVTPSDGQVRVRGELLIRNGGVVTLPTVSGNLDVIREDGAAGHLNVDGEGSKLVVPRLLLVGKLSGGLGGELMISRGAIVESGTAKVAGAGVARISGEGSQWRVGGRFDLENFTADSSMEILAGAHVLASDFRMGYGDGTHHTTLTVDGLDSGLFVTNALEIGSNTAGNTGARLSVTHGAQVTSSTTTVGSVRNAYGVVQIDGPGSKLTTFNTLTIGSHGAGSVLVSNAAAIKTGTIALGTSNATNINFGAVGTLAIGAFAADSAAAAGNLEIANGINIAKSGRLIFNHTDAAYAFGTSIVSFAAGDGLLEQRAGTTILNGAVDRFTGATHVIGGTLIVNSDLGSNLVTVEAGAALGGSGSVKNLVAHDGAIIMPGNSPGVLTVDGNFTLETGARLALEIAGTMPGTEHDALSVGGDVVLQSGSLIELSFLKGFAPRAGQQFELFNLGGRLTNAATIEVTGLHPGWLFELDFNSSVGKFTLHSLNDGFAIAAVPLPLSAWLLGSALLSLGARRVRTIQH